MGIFSLGLFKGVADGYSKYAENERKAEAEKAKLDKEYALKERLEKYKVDEQSRLKQYEAQLDLGKEKRKHEEAIAATFGYFTPEGKPVTGDYEGEKRLPTYQERQQLVQDRLNKNIPLFSPSGYNWSGVGESIKARNKGGAAGRYLTFDMPNGVGAQMVPIPTADPEDYTEGELIRQNIPLVMETISQGDRLKQIMVEHQNGDPHGNFKALYNTLVPNGGQVLLDNYKTAESKETGETTYSDPLVLFNIEQNIPDPTTRKWFVDNIVTKAVGFADDILYELAGVDSRIPYTRQELRENVLLRDKEKYERFLKPDQDGKPRIRDDIYNEANRITKNSGVRIQNVMGFVSKSADPLKALKDLQKDSKYFNDVLVDTSKPTIDINIEAEDELQKMYEKYGVETMQDKKQLIRMMLNRDPHGRANRAITVDAAGNRSLVYTGRQKKYQIDPKQARVEAGAAKDSMEIIDNMLSLAAGPQGARPGLTGSVINFSAGIQTIASGLTEIIGNVKMSDEKRAEYLNNINEFKKFDFLGVSENQQARQRLFGLLGEQLAFALAAVAQGGASGRAISDRDVEAWRSKLGLKGVLMSEVGVRKNLEYLREEMKKSLSINSDYARAQRKNDFLATYILDTTERKNKTIDQLVFNSEYDYTDQANPVAKTDRAAAQNKAPRMMVNPDGSARKVAPKD